MNKEILLQMQPFIGAFEVLQMASILILLLISVAVIGCQWYLDARSTKTDDTNYVCKFSKKNC